MKNFLIGAGMGILSLICIGISLFCGVQVLLLIGSYIGTKATLLILIVLIAASVGGSQYMEYKDGK
jgi:hypothetical protein